MSTEFYRTNGDRRIVITGMGPVTPIGVGNKQMLESLQKNRPGYSDISDLSTNTHYPLSQGGRITNFNLDDFIEQSTDAPYRSAVRSNRLDPASQYALAGAKLAMKQADLLLDGDFVNTNPNIDVSLGIALLGVQTYEKLKTQYGKDSKISPLAVPMYMPNAIASTISTYFNLRGETYTVNTACASAVTAMIKAYQTLQQNHPQTPNIIITGGSEASLTGFVGASFLSPRAMSPQGISRPFEKDRNGFGPGEGAGIFVMETLENAVRRDVKPLVEITGYSANHDYFSLDHPTVSFTSSDTSGNQLADSIQTLLEHAKISLSDVDTFNAHGTGTKANDLTEANAINLLWKKTQPDILALKGFMGHSGGATAATEIIGGILGMQNDFIAGNPHLEKIDPDLSVTIQKEPIKKKNTVQIKHTAGFGGNDALLVYTLFEE